MLTPLRVPLRSAAFSPVPALARPLAPANLPLRRCAAPSLAEVALNFKEQGNEYFVGKRPREALGFYTQGIEAGPADQKLLEVLLVNRAACNLALGRSPPCAPTLRTPSSV